MFCRHCGNQLGDGDLFCSSCGNSTGNETMAPPQPPQPDTAGKSEKPKLPWKWIGIAAGICILAISVGAAIFALSENYIKGQKEKEIAELNTWLSQAGKDKSKYIFSEDDEKIWNDLVDNMAELLKDETVKKAVLSECQRQIEDFLKKMEEQNKSKIQDLQDTLEQADLTNAFDTDLEAIESYKKDVGKFLDDGVYQDAWNLLQKWKNLSEAVNAPLDTYQVNIKQYDISGFPNVKLYLDVTDESGTFVQGLDESVFYLNEQRNVDGEMKRQTITNAVQLNENAGISIALAADISGSMEESMDEAKIGMKNFIKSVQFDKGDEVELTQFSDYSYVCCSFTNNEAALIDAIDRMYADGMTRLYDTLISEIERICSRQNAKCVIGFTDGYDNESNYTYQDVINYAVEYQIPVFLIGIGSDCDEATLQEIALQTGGVYRNISEISSLEEIYQQIYKQEKEAYLLEYTVADADDFESPCNLEIYIRTKEREGGCIKGFQFEPKDFFDVMYNRFLVAGIDCQTKGERNLLDSGLIITSQEAYQNKDCVAYQSQASIDSGGIGSNNSNVFEVLVYYDVLNVYPDGDGYILYGVSNYDVKKTKRYGDVKNDLELGKIRDYYGEGIDPNTIFWIEDNIVNYEKLKLVKDTDGKWKFYTRVYEREDGSKPYSITQVYDVMIDEGGDA